jgi:hypothetical protein
MKTKQIFSIMVLVGIAFAGVAFAGPTALPPNGNLTSLPIFGVSPDVSQSKIGTAPSGTQVPRALQIGTNDPSSNATLWVEGGISVFGSTGTVPGGDGITVGTDLTTTNLYMNNTVGSSTTIENLTITTLKNSTVSTPRSICLDGQFKKLKPCQ